MREDDQQELSFRSKRLSADDIHGLSSLLAGTKELDLSNNLINKLSRGFPSQLIALNLSNNKFSSLTGFDNLRHIRMLRIQSNKISSTWGLQSCVHLEHLDLGNNRIKVVEGLETLTRLKTLLLNKNNIKSMESIRSLSFNSSLEELSLVDNKVMQAPNYRGALKHLIETLKVLDGKPLYFRDGNRCPGYGVRFECRHTVNNVDPKSVLCRLNNQNSFCSDKSATPPEVKPPHMLFENTFSSDDSVISSSSSQVIVVEDDITKLPWRKPPSIIPKNSKGKEMYESQLVVSPNSKNHSRTRKSLKHKNQEKEAKEVEQPKERWDDYFVYDSHASPSKRASDKASKRLNGASKAILGSHHYDAPPPPPPKVNKYPLSLGLGGHQSALQSSSIMIGNEVSVRPLLASPGMRERLSPRKSYPPPLFPGGEQYWAHEVEEDENNATTFFREELRQHEENLRAQQLQKAPPLLPCEQSTNQYRGEDSDESFTRSRLSSGGSYYSEEEADEESVDHDAARNDALTSQQRGTFFGLYKQTPQRDAHQSQPSTGREEPSSMNNNPSVASSFHRSDHSRLTSQRRGTFFGLYGKPTAERPSEEDAHHQKTPSAGRRKSTGSAAARPGDKTGRPSLTSQRRGTFFGLYDKQGAAASPAVNTHHPKSLSASHRSPPRKGKSRSPSPERETKREGEREHTEGQSGGSKPLTSQRRGTFFGLYDKKASGQGEAGLDTHHPKAVSASHRPSTAKPPSRQQPQSEPSPPEMDSLERNGDIENEDENKGEHHSNATSSDKLGIVYGGIHAEDDENECRVHIAEPDPPAPTERNAQNSSPQELQSILQQMYERKMSTLQKLRASREAHQHQFS